MGAVLPQVWLRDTPPPLATKEKVAHNFEVVAKLPKNKRGWVWKMLESLPLDIQSKVREFLEFVPWRMRNFRFVHLPRGEKWLNQWEIKNLEVNQWVCHYASDKRLYYAPMLRLDAQAQRYFWVVRSILLNWAGVDQRGTTFQLIHTYARLGQVEMVAMLMDAVANIFVRSSATLDNIWKEVGEISWMIEVAQRRW